MERTQNKKPFELSWQVIAGVAGLLFALGKFYASQEGLSSDVKSDADRINRQYETISKMSERITILEKQQEYQRGLRDAIK